MSIQNLLARYSLTARSQGESEETIKHTTRIVGFFDKFMGGITDVAKIQADDLRRFILNTQEKEKWAGLPQAKGQKVSATTVNTYTRAIKGFFKWLNREGIIQTDPFVGVRAPKLPQRLPKVISEKALIAGVIAVRQALDFSTGRAIATCIVGWIIYVLIVFLATVFLVGTGALF